MPPYGGRPPAGAAGPRIGGIRFSDTSGIASTDQPKKVYRQAPTAPSVTSTDKCSLVHGGHTCPGLHGSGTTKILARDFSTIFDVDQHAQVLIPIFQRTYAWRAEVQGVKLWSDLTAKFDQIAEHTGGSLNADDMPEVQHAVLRHSTGKILLKIMRSEQQQQPMLHESMDCDAAAQTQQQQPQSMVIIDGQQRVTTMSLLLTSLHEVACRLREDETSTELVKWLEKMIFVDLPAAERWAENVVKTLYSRSNSAAIVSSGAIWQRGNEFGTCPGSRLVPSQWDHHPYFEIITRRLLQRTERAWFGAEDQCRNLFGEAMDFSHETATSLQASMFKLFVERTCEFASSPASDRSERIKFLFRHLIHHTGYVGVEILKEEVGILNQVFLFHQCQSLLSCGGLLYVPAPGEQLTAFDMVRNVLLMTAGPGYSCASAELAALHKAKWMPIELPVLSAIKRYAQEQPHTLDARVAFAAYVAATKEESEDSYRAAEHHQQQQLLPTVDDFIAAFVIKMEERTNKFKSHWRQTAVEWFINFLSGKLENPKDSSALCLYSRFHSVFEFLLQQEGAVESEVAAALLQGLADSVPAFVARLEAGSDMVLPKWRTKILPRH